MKQAIDPRRAFMAFLLTSCLYTNAFFSKEAAVICPTLIVTPAQATICAGQNINLTASGAVNYTWTSSGGSPQFTSSIVVTPTTSTLYKVYGDDGLGCTDSAQAIVVVQPLPNVTTASNKSLVCSGDKVILNAGGGGTGTHTFQWSANAGGATTSTVQVTLTVSTVYGVTVTSNSTGCSASKTIQVNVFDPIITLVGSGTVCAGTPLTYSINGSPAPASYSIYLQPSPGGDNTVPPGTTNFTLSMLSSSNSVNCPDSATFSVHGLPQPVITLTASPSIVCVNEPVTLTAGGGQSYTWSVPATGNMATVTPGNNNLYTVTGSGANGCVKSTNISIPVSPCTGIAVNNTVQDHLMIFPHPNIGDFTLQADKDLEIRLVNSLGQEIKRSWLTIQNRHSINFSGLPPGIYFVATGEGKMTISKKVMVTK
jgi:hypothetical protein